MWYAAVTSLAGLWLGGFLAFSTRKVHRSVRPARIAASILVAATVLVALLPEAFEALGLRALFGFLAAFAIPFFTRFVAHMGSRGAHAHAHHEHGHAHEHEHAHGHRPGRQSSPDAASALAHVSEHRVPLELGFLGVVVHQATEAVVLGTHSGPAHHGHDHGALVWAVALHTVPLAAVVTDAFVRTFGVPRATLRLVWLSAATLAGYVVATWLPEGLGAVPLGWITAASAGLLCHVVLHDHCAHVPSGQGAPRPPHGPA